MRFSASENRVYNFTPISFLVKSIKIRKVYRVIDEDSISETAV